MKTRIQDFVVNSHDLNWIPLVENEIPYQGIFIKSLLYNDIQQRSTHILLKFEPGASYPYHNHPGGEELFVLEGEAIIEDAVLSSGCFLYTPPGKMHSVRSIKGCILLFRVPEEVEIVLNM